MNLIDCLVSSQKQGNYSPSFVTDSLVELGDKEDEEAMDSIGELPAASVQPEATSADSLGSGSRKRKADNEIPRPRAQRQPQQSVADVMATFRPQYATRSRTRQAAV